MKYINVCIHDGITTESTTELPPLIQNTEEFNRTISQKF